MGLLELFKCEVGYENLWRVLYQALAQAQSGKGKERHASSGETFENQSIMAITNTVGLGFPVGQAMKKLGEVFTAPLNDEPAIAELRGAIVYIAAAILYLERTNLNDTTILTSDQFSGQFNPEP